jgi:hypothetical protein
VVELNLEDIYVVREFLDVFPDDLHGMLPERAIEFKIELQPSTAPKRTASMVVLGEKLRRIPRTTQSG